VSDLVLIPRRCNILDAPLRCVTSVMTAFPLQDRGTNPAPGAASFAAFFSLGPLAGCLMSPTVRCS